jgi:hypothetical protein
MACATVQLHCTSVSIKSVRALPLLQAAAERARLDTLQREVEERAALRAAMVFRARPLPDLSAQPPAKAVAKPTTKPVSPRLRTKKRAAKEKRE